MASADPHPTLTARQLEVLELMAKGLSNPEIAHVLGVARATIKTHVSAVIEALDVTNRTEATARLYELGLGANAGEVRDDFTVDSFGARPAIAILPFDNFSSDPGFDALADGIVEDLTTGLARWRWFPVISRNSSFAFKGQPIDVKEVSRALGARYVVEGSIRTAGDHMRITVQVLDGSNAHHVWAERFDLEQADRFDAIDRIIERMISALEPALVRIGGMRAASKHPDRLDAWESTSQGFFHLTQNTLEGFEDAARAYDRALALDSRLPAAHAGLAAARFHLYCHRTSIGPLRQPESFADSADQAARLDPDDPETHYAVAMLGLLAGDPVRGLTAADRAVDLGPSDPAVHRIRAWALSANDRPAEAAEAVARAQRLSPRDPHHALMVIQLAACRMELGQMPEAETLLDEGIRDAPDLALPHALLAICKVSAGEIEHARTLVTRMQQLAPTYSPLRAMNIVTSTKNFEIAKALYAVAGWKEAEFEA